MSIALKWVLAIIVLAGAGWLLWWSGWLGKNNAAQTAAVANTATTTQATSTPPRTNGMTAASDTSDAALTTDIGAVDTQLAGLSKDGVQVAASLSDKPVAQSF